MPTGRAGGRAEFIYQTVQGIQFYYEFTICVVWFGMDDDAWFASMQRGREREKLCDTELTACCSRLSHMNIINFKERRESRRVEFMSTFWSTFHSSSP